MAKVTPFHVYKGQVAICPTCNCRPCPPDCVAQTIPDVSTLQGPPAPELIRVRGDEERGQYVTAGGEGG